MSDTTLNTSDISSEMKRAYLDYAMTVIVARALPDVRDGLKPVHRRILYAMWETGIRSTGKFRKSATVVGEVMKSLHPHGDVPIYEALVRMAQDFSMRYQLIHGQGNFGSIDGDPPAAMRYTEVKLKKIAEEMMQDIEKETVSWGDNFDASMQEPHFLPAKLPNLLLMGAEGIAVGMATKIPPHNLTELCDALLFMTEKEKVRVLRQGAEETTKTKKAETISALEPYTLSFDVIVDDILQFVKGPDFPTAGVVYGANDIKQVYATGRGSMMVRGVVDEEDLGKGKMAIVVKELPYQVNKANLVQKIANLAVDKKIVGISDLRDESNREGIRIVIELKRDASYKKVLNNLFKYTELQTTFPANMVALVNGVPQTLSIQNILEEYVKHRVNIVTKRSEFELKQAKHRAHILEGYLIALDHIDEVIKVIRGSKDEPEAQEKLMKQFGLSEIQAHAILEMQLRRLTGLERDKIENELAELRKLIDYLETLLKDVMKVLGVVRDEIKELKEKFGDERKTKVVKSRPGEISDEMLIENKEVFVVLTKEGYIKQVPNDTFRVQNRGGQGVTGMETKETDNIANIVKAMMHDYILYFTNQGRVFQGRVWDIPQGTRISKGKAIVNLLTLRPEEKVTSILNFDAQVTPKDNTFILMSTKQGTVKKTPFVDFANIRSKGIIAINLDPGDELLWINLTDGKQNVIMTSESGKAIVFKEEEVRPTGRSSRGVRGMEIEKNDEISAADVFDNKDFDRFLLVIGQNGVGKKTQLSQFKGQHRGGKGVKVASVDEKMGRIAFVQIMNPEHTQLIITSEKGMVVKIPLKDIPSRSRNAKGVILMRVKEHAGKVVSATLV